MYKRIFIIVGFYGIAKEATLSLCNPSTFRFPEFGANSFGASRYALKLLN